MKELCRINTGKRLWMSGFICLLMTLVYCGMPGMAMGAPKVPAPTGLATALNNTTNQVAAKWSAPVQNPDGYLVERSQSATKGFSQVLAVKGTITSAVDNLDNATGTYYYRVRGYKIWGSKTYYSDYTNVSDVTTDTISAAPGSFAFSSSAYSVDESAGLVNVTINRVGGSAGAASVEFRTRTFNGYGTADYLTDYGTIDWKPVSFADGETSKVVSIAIKEDDAVEGDETFSVLLQSPTNGTTLGDIAAATVTIKDNDESSTDSASSIIPSGPVKIFPGAEGFGTDSIAGRGGKIIRVTNLNDSGTGSLRAALEASVPRTIVFEVGGVIHLQSKLIISNPYCTVAGQTAPGQGIMIRNWGMYISTHDVLLQHLAIRPGDEGSGPYDTLDGICINGSGAYNIVLDHCSISWAIDENLDTWMDIHDVTISNTIISECLRDSMKGYPNSKGYLAGRRNKNIAFLNNLLAHNEVRNPLIYGDTSFLLANNVFYNAGAYSFTSIGDGWGDGPPVATVVGNIYKAGPGTTAICAVKIENIAPSGTKVYEANNYYNAGPVRGGSTGYFVSSPPVSLSGITVATGENEIMSKVLTNAGARPGMRDAVDNRIANPSTGEVITGKGSWVDSVNSSGIRAPGGWPNYPLAYRNFDEGTNPNGDDDGNGYTNVEEILYRMALEVEGK